MPEKRTLALLRALTVTSALIITLVPRLAAQAAPDQSANATAAPSAAAAPAPSAAAENAGAEETITLSPFVVDADSDSNGYKANSTLAGTRVRTDLKDVASAITVVTQKFLQDTGAVNSEDLLTLTPSTEVAGIKGNFTGIAGVATFEENTTSQTTRVRGLDTADNTRDYYLSDIPWDAFNVGRVDLQRGPNSILFGTGSPAGIINTSTDDASFKTSYELQNRTDKFGSDRDVINLNQVLVDDVLAVRFAAVTDDELYEQSPAYNNTTRYYGALRFDPKIFDEHSKTSIRVKYENGKIRSNNPRQDPPVDEITPWFRTGTDAYGNPGYDKLTINEFSLTNPNPSGTPLPGASGSVLDGATYELGGWAETRSYWADNLNYYEATPGQSDGSPGGTAIKTIVAEPNVGNGLDNHGIGQLDFRPEGIPSEQQYAAYVGTTGAGTISNTNSNFKYPGNPIPGGVYYADTVLTDPTIFDFYKYLLDGPNKREWQDWKAVNVAIDQSFFDQRLAFELGIDHQAYDQGANQWLTGSNYAISIDVNQTYADGTPNPNVGRPYVGNAASNTNYSYATVRDTIRFTPTYELRPEDFISNPQIAKLIGKQNFTGIVERYQLTTSNYSWAEYATTPSYEEFNQANSVAGVNALGSGGEFDWIAYLGPSLMNASSASGANLNPINFTIAPPENQRTWNFNSNWNQPTNPNDVGYVNPAATYSYISTKLGSTQNGTQADNPANYVGWQWEPITWMNQNNPTDFPNLVTSANRIRFKDDSEGITYQGHMLNGDLVPALGWREDRITNYQTSAQTDTNNGFTTMSFPDNLASRTDVHGTTKSWGAVYHLPATWFSNISWDPTVSLEYNDSQNFKADAQRMNLAGLPIPNATGSTREFGVTVTALNDRISLKANWFKTLVQDATLDTTEGNSIGGLGNNAYYLSDGLIWGYGWATALQDGLKGLTPNSNYYDYGANDGYTAGSAADTNYNLNGGTAPNGTKYAGGNAVVAAWIHNPLPANFFNSFNLSPSINPTTALTTGNLRDGFNPPPAYSAEPDTGGGSIFGDHVTTVNNQSEGYELELTAQPIKGWDVSLNYSHVKAIHSDVDPASVAFMSSLAGWLAGPAGQIREWYNGGNTLYSVWGPYLVAPFTVLLNQQGHEAPEISPWRLNGVTTYTFQKGILKGAFIGGDLKIDAGRIIGYHYNPNFVNVNASDPNYASYTSVTTGGLDINEPFTGSIEEHVDAWVGYNWKLSHKINYRIQLNLSNVGEKDKLIPAQMNPDGTIALARISYGMGWQLTNSFDF